MKQWQKLLATLSLRQRTALIAAAVVVAAALFAATRWKHEHDFRPLFVGVAAEDASGIVQKLKETGVEYRISDDGGTISVPAARLAELRLQMAGAGLPKTGRIGLELFDRTNLGTTDFAEHVNYGRALEGELERSIKSIDEVDQARVHITFPKDSIFVESRLPAKASVLLRVKNGRKISSQNVVAICHLVASAVEGLLPEAVSVLDMRGNLLSRPRRPAGNNETSEESLEYRQRLERDMLAKLQATLEPLVGPEKFRASVAIECDLTSGEESHETYDPERTVMLTTQKSEESGGGTTASAGIPGTPSNLPRPTSRPTTSGTGLVRRTENVAYQPSKVVRHVRMPQGAVKRVSVALLIDHSVRWEEKGGRQVRQLIPPSPETLKAIREVAAAAIGFNVERGDQLVVESLAFESTVTAEPPQNTAPPSGQASRPGAIFPVDQRLIIGGAGAVVLLIAVAVFLFRRGRKKKKMPAVAVTSQIDAASNLQKLADGDSGELKKQLTDYADQKRQALAEAQQQLRLRPVQTQKSEVLAGYLRDAVKADAAPAVSVIRSWLREE